MGAGGVVWEAGDDREKECSRQLEEFSFSSGRAAFVLDCSLSKTINVKDGYVAFDKV